MFPAGVNGVLTIYGEKEHLTFGVCCQPCQPPPCTLQLSLWKPPQRPSSFRAVGKSLPNPPILSLESSHLGDITGMIRLKTLFPTEDNWHYSGQETIANKTEWCAVSYTLLLNCVAWFVGVSIFQQKCVFCILSPSLQQIFFMSKIYLGYVIWLQGLGD